MSAYKQFLSQDVIVSPFTVNKGFTFNYREWANSDVQLDRFEGINSDFLTNQDTTGTLSTEYQVLVYNSIKELYYSNYTTSSFTQASPLQTQSLFPGDNTNGDRYVGNPDSVGRYYNYLQSSNDVVRYWPTGSDDVIGMLSIPSRLYGDYIQPNSFKFTVVDTDNITHVITDDGNGNLYVAGTYVGNIIYSHGIATFTFLTDNLPPAPEGYGISSYGESIYGGGISLADLLSTNATCSFSSSLTIYETQYKATIRENEFNFSQNPSILSGSTNDVIYDFATGSYFSPYVTTVGLYDEFQNLLAVGKLSQPLPTSRTTDTTIFINIDR